MAVQSDDLRKWNDGVEKSRDEYARFPITRLEKAAEKPAGSVPRERYMELVAANAKLSAELRATRAALRKALLGRKVASSGRDGKRS